MLVFMPTVLYASVNAYSIPVSHASVNAYASVYANSMIQYDYGRRGRHWPRFRLRSVFCFSAGNSLFHRRRWNDVAVVRAVSNIRCSFVDNLSSFRGKERDRERDRIRRGNLLLLRFLLLFPAGAQKERKT